MSGILGPGHHAVFDRGGKTYIVYHRHSLPFDSMVVRRQLCVDELVFEADGEIRKVKPTHLDPDLLRREPRERGAPPVTVTAFSALDEVHKPSTISDDNYATRWSPSKDDASSWLQLDLAHLRHPRKTEIRFEYPWKTYFFRLETSIDGSHWTEVADEEKLGASGSPDYSGSPSAVSLPSALLSCDEGRACLDLRVDSV